MEPNDVQALRTLLDLVARQREANESLAREFGMTVDDGCLPGDDRHLALVVWIAVVVAAAGFVVAIMKGMR